VPSTREIRRRIRSVKNLAQITRAMEMVSSSRLRRAQRNVLATRPYADRILELMGHLMARSRGSRAGTLLESRPNIRSVALIVVTPDRGMAGSLVSNLLRRMSQFYLDETKKGRSVDLIAIGKKGRDFLVRNHMPMVAELTKLGDFPTLEQVLGAATGGIGGFREGKYDEVYVMYAEFVNTLVQRPRLKRLVPVELPSDVESTGSDYTYEPDQDEVLRSLLPRFVEVTLYQSILEAVASSP